MQQIHTESNLTDLRTGTSPPADGAQYVQTEVGGDDAQKDEDGGQNQAALFERKWDGQDATADDGGDQSERCRDDGGLSRRAVVLGIQDLNVRAAGAAQPPWNPAEGAVACSWYYYSGSS